MAATEMCVIYNPAAGRGRATARLAKLRQSLGDRAEFRPTEGPGDAEQLARAAAAAGFPVVAAAGGDGTVHDVANGVLRAAEPDVALAVFPVGSANDYAHALGIEKDWWLRQDETAPTRRVDAGSVRGADGRQRYFVNGLGLGFNCAVTLEARRTPWLQGVPLYLVALLRALRTRYCFPLTEVTADGATRRGPTLALTLALGPREGAFVLAPSAAVDDGLFDYLHVGRLPRPRLIGYVPRMVTGRLPKRDPAVRTGRCRRLQVRCEQTLTVHTDGEFFCLPEDGLREIDVEILPGALPVRVRLGRAAR